MRLIQAGTQGRGSEGTRLDVVMGIRDQVMGQRGTSGGSFLAGVNSAVVGIRGLRILTGSCLVQTSFRHDPSASRSLRTLSAGTSLTEREGAEEEMHPTPDLPDDSGS